MSEVFYTISFKMIKVEFRGGPVVKTLAFPKHGALVSILWLVESLKIYLLWNGQKTPNK